MVVGVGSIVADILMVSDDLRIYHKNLVKSQTYQVGGVIPSALLALSKLDVSCRFISAIGDDGLGEILISKLNRHNVNTDGLKIVPDSKTPVASVIVDSANGDRTSFYSIGRYSEMTAEDIKPVFPGGCELLLIDGHNVTLSEFVIDEAKTKKIPVMLDLGSNKKDLDRLIKKSDIVTVSKLYWKEKWPKNKPEEIAEIMSKLVSKMVVLTMGEEGCLIADENGILRQPGFKIQVVDTNGAGDIFFGTFAYGLLKHWETEQIARFASAAAAINCTKIGKAYSTREEIESFLNARK